MATYTEPACSLTNPVCGTCWTCQLHTEVLIEDKMELARIDASDLSE